MRLLKNICNEFHLYYSNINNDKLELDANKMFAIIVYKNLFPLDFTLLQMNQGFVFYIFNNKPLYIKNEKDKLLENITNCDLEIKNIEENHHKSIEEIKEKYKVQRNEDRYLTLRRLMILEQTQQFELDCCQSEYKKNIELINNEKENIQKEILQLPSKKLKYILNKTNIDQVFDEYPSNSNNIEKNEKTLEIKNSPYFSLIKYLIRNGYIDETYADYMTYFYSNGFTKADKIYLRSITDESAKKYVYKLNNPELIIKKLQHQKDYFSKPEILNVDLINYLLTYSENYTEELKAILCQFSVVENVKFINVFWSAASEENLQKFIILLSEYLPNFFQIALSSQLVSDYIRQDLSLKTLYCLPQEVIKKINEYDNCLRNYIANSSDYLNIAEPDVEQLVKQFVFLQIKFAQIKYDTANKDLFNKVYHKSLYELNFANIQLMLTTQYSTVDEQDIIHGNYSCVQNEPDSPLAAYIAKNIDVYLHLILANCKQKISDNETKVLYLLNHNDISQEHKLEYIEYLQTPIASLDKVENTELWQNILCLGKLVYNEKNILCYFQHIKETDESIDEYLIEFINNNEKRLDFKGVSNDEDKDVKGEFFDVIIINQKITNHKYKEILSTLGFHYEEFNIENIAINKFKILVDNKITLLNYDKYKKESRSTLDFIRLNYDNKAILYFIQKNLTDYLDLIEEDNELFDYEEALSLINKPVDDDSAIRLLKCTDNPVSIWKQNFSPAVMVYVLEYNFNKDDLVNLIKDYDKYSEDIQNLIVEQSIKNCELIVIKQDTDIADNLLHKLFISEKLGENKKIDLFIQALPYKYMHVAERRQALKSMQLDEFNKIWNRGTPKIKCCDEYSRLLLALKAQGLIQDFYVGNKQEKYYRITKRNS